MKPSAMSTSGTMSKAPPVWPPNPLVFARAVKKTMLSRTRLIFFCRVARCSASSPV